MQETSNEKISTYISLNQASKLMSVCRLYVCQLEIYGNKITSNPLFQQWIRKPFWKKLLQVFLCSCPCSQILLGWTLNICPQVAKNKSIMQNVCHYLVGAGMQIHTHTQKVMGRVGIVVSLLEFDTVLWWSMCLSLKKVLQMSKI